MIGESKIIALKDGSTARLDVRPMLSGDNQVRQTISDMEMFAVRDAGDEAIIDIARKQRGKTPFDTIRNTYKWMITNYKYVSDGKNEVVTAPKYTARKITPFKYFDCDDMSTLLACVLIANDIKCAFKAISWRETNPPKQYTHVYLMAEIPGEGWIPIDAVMRADGLGNERSPVYRSLVWEVRPNARISGVAALSDGVTTNDNIDYAQEAVNRVFAGENVADVFRSVAKKACVDGVRDKFYEARYQIAGAATAVIAVSAFAGYVAGRKKMNGQQ